MTGEYILKQILDAWGVSKTLQVTLLALSAAGIVFFIGANVVPNNPTILIEEENR
jgi:hypothetical protein